MCVHSSNFYNIVAQLSLSLREFFFIVYIPDL